MNRNKLTAKVLISLALFQYTLSPIMPLAYATGVAPITETKPSVSSVNINSINDRLTTQGDNGRGLNVYVQNYSHNGSLLLNRYVCANNVGTTDYPVSTFNYSKTGADIHEVQGETPPRVTYKDTGNPQLNYLIENKIISRDVSIHDENFIESKPLKQFVTKSDLVMALIKSTNGVIEDTPQTIQIKMNEAPIKATEYKNRYLIRQDIFQDNLTIIPNYVYVQYTNPNNKLLYMDKACKMGLLNRAELSPNYKPYSKGNSYLEVKSGDCLKNETLDYYKALTLVEKALRYSEGYIDDKDISVINFKYGAKLTDDVPDTVIPTVRYLIAKGIIYPNESLTDRDFNLQDFARLLYRVKNKSQRYSVKSEHVTDVEKKLIDKGLQQTKIELISGFNGHKEIIPQPSQITYVGYKAKRVDICNFLIKGFFTPQVLNYMKNTLGMSDTPTNRQLYADRFYITIQRYYKSNLLTDSDRNFNLKVDNDDLRLQIEESDLNWLKSLARRNECKLELNSKTPKDLPHYVRFPDEPQQGTYVIKPLQSENDKGVNIEKTGGLNIPKYRATVDTSLGEFILTQKLYLAKDTGLDSFNYVTEEGEVVPLQTGIDKGKVPVTDDCKKPKAETSDGVVCYTVKFKVSAMTQPMAIKILHSKLSVNKNKYTGYCAVDGYVDATKQSYYVGKSFLEYFGHISCIRDRVLYNRQTGTYCLILDGLTKGTVNTASNREYKTVICGSTVKRYPLDSPDLVFSSSGSVFYSLDAIQDLLGGKAFSHMGTSKTFFVDQLADETLADVYLNSNKPEFIQKDYTVSYNKQTYVDMTNANFANDYVIMDMFNIMRAKKKNLSVKLADKRINDQNLRMIVKWIWVVPAADVQKAKGDGELTLTKVANLLETPSTSGTMKSLCDLNKSLTNRLLECAIGTESSTYSYATSGYLVPQITLLCTKDSNARSREIEEVKNFLYKYVCRYGETISPATFNGLKTDVEKFDAFNKYMTAQFSNKDNHYLFFQALAPKIDKNIFNYGGYIMDNKGSVYQQLPSFVEGNEGFSPGCGIMYSGNKNAVYVSPFSQPTTLTANMASGNIYQYTDGRTYMYIQGDGDKLAFMKNPSECDPIKPPSKFFQIKDITSWDLQKSISIEVLKRLRDYRKRDDLIKDNLKDLDPEKTMDSNAKEYLLSMPTTNDIAVIESARSLKLPQVIRTDPSLNSKRYTVLASSDYYNTYMKNGWEGSTAGKAIKEYYKDDKGNAVVTNILAPKINLDMSKYTITSLSNQASTLKGLLDGTILKYGPNDTFSNLSYKHPNFNIAEQWSVRLMEMETERENPFKERVKFVKSIGEDCSITFNGTDRYKMDRNGYIYTLDGKDVSPSETTTIMLSDGTQVKSLQNLITKDGEHYRLSPTLKVLEITKDNTGLKCYQLLTQQNGIEAFNLNVPFNVDLEVELGKSYRFSYDKYDGEIPTNLTDIIQKAIKYYNEKASQSVLFTIALEIIRLLFGLIMAMWCGFMLDRSQATHRVLENIRADCGVDFMKILTVGMCDLDTDIKLHKISVATLVFMFIQGLILIKYIGLPTF